MKGECCICEINSSTDEAGIRRKDRQLPLQPKPEILLLPFQNTYKTICIRCTQKNNQLIDAFTKTKEHFVPRDFITAINQGNTDHAKLICSLLPIGDCVHYHDPDTGETALHLCSRHGFWHLARFILERRRKRLEENSEEHAPQESRMQILHENLVTHRRRSKNKEDLVLLDAKDKYGRTCLHRACTLNFREDLCLLYSQAGSDLNEYVNDSTPLMLACACGNVKMIQTLHEHGAYLNKRSLKDGRTALMKSAGLGEPKVVEKLIALGSEVEYVDHSGLSAYDMALKRKCLDINYDTITQILAKVIGNGDTTEMGSKSKSSSTSSNNNTTTNNHNHHNTTTNNSVYGYRARMKRKKAMAWQEHFDDVAELPYWWNIQTNETTWDCPIGVEPSYKQEQDNSFENRRTRLYQQEQQEQQELKQEKEQARSADAAAAASGKYILPYLKGSRQDKRKEKEKKLLAEMREEYKEYYHNARNIVADMAPASTATAQSEYYQNLPDRTVRKRKKTSTTPPQPSVVRPMNPPMFYHCEQMMSNKYLPSLYTSWEEPGIDFPLKHISTDPAVEAVEEQHHVWPGCYKRGGMGGEVGHCGRLVKEEVEEEDIPPPPLYSKRALARAQEARDFFTLSVATKHHALPNSCTQPGSYALYTNEKKTLS